MDIPPSTLSENLPGLVARERDREISGEVDSQNRSMNFGLRWIRKAALIDDSFLPASNPGEANYTDERTHFFTAKTAVA